MAFKPTSIKILRQEGTDELYATWTYSATNKKKYTAQKSVWNASKKKSEKKKKLYIDTIAKHVLKWSYKIGGTWFTEETIEVTSKASSSGTWSSKNNRYTPKEGAEQVRVRITPKSSEYKYKDSKGNIKSAKWWTDGETGEKIDTGFTVVPDAPDIDSFTILGTKMKVTFKFEPNTVDRIEWQLIFNQNDPLATALITLTPTQMAAGYAKIEDYQLSAVGAYQIRARAGMYDSGQKKVIWSDYSGDSSLVDTSPYAPSNLTVVPIEGGKMRITWSSVANVTGYQIEYMQKPGVEYGYASIDAAFEDGLYSTEPVGSETTVHVMALDSGIWLFRIRSLVGEAKSDPTAAVEGISSTKPGVPATWSSVPTATVVNTLADMEPVYLYWINKAIDGTAQEWAVIHLNVGEGRDYYAIVNNTAVDDLGNPTDEVFRVSMWYLGDTDPESGRNIPLYSNESCTVLVDDNFYNLFRAANVNTIKWGVKTKGLNPSYSEWSIERTILAYIKPTISVTAGGGQELPSVLRSYPIHMVIQASPNTQTPISYYFQIITANDYETVDAQGNVKQITVGEEIYSHYEDTSLASWTFDITAHDVELLVENSYILSVTLYMNSGLTATYSHEFSVDWDQNGIEPDANLVYYPESRIATIQPFCNMYIGIINTEEDAEPSSANFGTGYLADDHIPGILIGSTIGNANVGDVYINTDTFKVYTCETGGGPLVAIWKYADIFEFTEDTSWFGGTVIDDSSETGIYPESGVPDAHENDYYLNFESGMVYVCTVPGSPTVAEWSSVTSIFWHYAKDTEISIYRKEWDGSFTLISERIPNKEENLLIRDIHPTLGVSRYRIVSTSLLTRAVAYKDCEIDTLETSVILQWDESAESAIQDDDVNLGEPIFNGNTLELPYNVTLQDSNNKDVSLIEYIGRSRPVSYYGTQRGEKITISAVFERTDNEKLELLRLLKVYHGDVYVREPSGLSYWASVSLSYSRSYNDLTIPVTLDITPVEGGA